MLSVSVAVLASVNIAKAAERRCEWVGDPVKEIVWTPWEVTHKGLIWDTQQRTCTVTWTGKGIWFTIVRLRTCSIQGGVEIGPDGLPVDDGGFYAWTESIIGKPEIRQGATAARTIRGRSCIFSTSNVSGLNETFEETRFTHEALCNTWEDASVSFDGKDVAFDECVLMSAAGVGFHEYVVSRTDGVNTDTLTFIIEVRPSYSFKPLRNADTINPSTIMVFHNNTPDAIDVDFIAEPNQKGLVMGEMLNNRALVPAGGTALVQVEFYTAPGFVIGPGQIPEATVFAREVDSSGQILAEAIVTPLPKSAVVPAVSEWGVIAMMLLMLTVATVVIGRWRSVAL